jgi:hypothetical protein
MAWWSIPCVGRCRAQDWCTRVWGREEEDPDPPLWAPSPRKLYWTDGDNVSMANMDGSNRTLLFSGQKGPVGMSCPAWPCSPPLIPPLGDAPRSPPVPLGLPKPQ